MSLFGHLWTQEWFGDIWNNLDVLGEFLRAAIRIWNLSKLHNYTLRSRWKPGDALDPAPVQETHHYQTISLLGDIVGYPYHLCLSTEHLIFQSGTGRFQAALKEKKRVCTGSFKIWSPPEVTEITSADYPFINMFRVCDKSWAKDSFPFCSLLGQQWGNFKL